MFDWLVSQLKRRPTPARVPPVEDTKTRFMYYTFTAAFKAGDTILVVDRAHVRRRVYYVWLN
jgi:hypothetical protein